MSGRLYEYRITFEVPDEQTQASLGEAIEDVMNVLFPDEYMDVYWTDGVYRQYVDGGGSYEVFPKDLPEDIEAILKQLGA